MDDLELKKRTRWAINRLASEKSLTNITLSSLMGFTATTLSNYRTMKNSPKTAFIIKFCQMFGYSQNWFMTGEGEPFPGAYKKYPEVCCPAGSAPSVHESAPPYGALVSEQKINIDEAQGKVYRVLSSGTALAAALYLNIQQFAAALDTGHELKVCQDQISGLQAQIDELKRQMERLAAVPIEQKEAV